jgi:hypothetical protein
MKVRDDRIHEKERHSQQEIIILSRIVLLNVHKNAHCVILWRSHRHGTGALKQLKDWLKQLKD